MSKTIKEIVSEYLKENGFDGLVGEYCGCTMSSLMDCDETGGFGFLENNPDVNGKLINWVIAGAETGPNARPMNPEWARSLRDQCRAADVPFFFKKMSGGAPIPDDLMVREWPE